jgi:putative addiction module killer protein
LARIRIGNFGDCETIQGKRGLYEMRIHFGSGYRIYFGKYKERIILLLIGGDKSTQKKDIKKAEQYWLCYLLHKKELRR